MHAAITFRSPIEQILALAHETADHVLAPRAQEADRASEPNPETFRALSESGLAGLAIQQEFGGIGASEEVRHQVSEILGAACGVTNFTLHQHWSACGFIEQGDSHELKRGVLPKLATGETWTGVGFSHLRRAGPPAARAQQVKGGYDLSGFIPWFSGWPLYRHGVLAAKLPDGREIFLFTPIEDSKGLEISSPMALCAMQGSGTVRLTLKSLFVAEENVCFIGEPNWLHNRDCTNIVGHAYNPLLVAAASVRLLRKIAQQKPLEAITESAEAFEAELKELRERVAFWSREENKSRIDYTAGALQARVATIDLAVRSSHGCVVASSGGGNALSHPAQRYYREAMFYSVQGQTEDVLQGTLLRLIERSETVR